MPLFRRGAEFDARLRSEVLSLVGPDTPVGAIENDRLSVGGITLDVGPLRSHWRSLQRRDRLPWLQAVLPTLLDPPKIPDRLGTTRQLRPALRPRAEIEAARLNHLADGVRQLTDQRPLIPHRPTGGDVVAVLLWDHPTAAVMIDQEQLSQWGARFDDLLDVAVDNLSDVPTGGWASEDGRLWTTGTGESFGAGRLLDPGFFTETGINNDVVVLLPDRSTVLACSVNDAIGIKHLCERGIETAGAAQPVSLRPLVGRPGRWRHLELTDSHPAATSLRRLSMLDFQAQYQILRPVLEELLGRDLVLGSYEIRTDERQYWHSATAWPQSSASLLPRADLVDLVTDDGLTVTVPWTMLHQLLGPSMEHTSHYPEMWRVERFPNRAELERLSS